MTRKADKKPDGMPRANEQKTTAIRRIGAGEGIGKTNREQASTAAIVSPLTSRLAAMLEAARPVLFIEVTTGGERRSSANSPEPH